MKPMNNDFVMVMAILEAIDDILDGKEVSDFMLSFPIVRRVAGLADMVEGRDNG